MGDFAEASTLCPPPPVPWLNASLPAQVSIFSAVTGAFLRALPCPGGRGPHDLEETSSGDLVRCLPQHSLVAWKDGGEGGL